MRSEQKKILKLFLIINLAFLILACSTAIESGNYVKDAGLQKILQDAHYVYYERYDSLLLAAEIIYSDISGSYAYQLTVMNMGQKPLALDYTEDNLYYQYQGEQILCKQLTDKFHYPSQLEPGKYFWWTYLVDAHYNKTINDIEGLTYIRGFVPYVLNKNRKAHWE